MTPRAQLQIIHQSNRNNLKDLTSLKNLFLVKASSKTSFLMQNFGFWSFLCFNMLEQNRYVVPLRQDQIMVFITGDNGNLLVSQSCTAQKPKN